MLFGFLWPLCAGVGFYGLFAIFNIFFKNNLPSLTASYAYNAGIATLTFGCYFHGVIEIYGTTREKYVVFYNVLGIILLVAALLFYGFGIYLKIKERKTQN